MLFYCIRAMTLPTEFCLLQKLSSILLWIKILLLEFENHVFHTPYLQDRKGSFKSNWNPLALVEYSFGHPMLISIPATSLSLKEKEKMKLFFSILEQESRNRYLFREFVPSSLRLKWELKVKFIWTSEFLASHLS